MHLLSKNCFNFYETSCKDFLGVNTKWSFFPLLRGAMLPWTIKYYWEEKLVISIQSATALDFNPKRFLSISQWQVRKYMWGKGPSFFTSFKNATYMTSAVQFYLWVEFYLWVRETEREIWYAYHPSNALNNLVWTRQKAIRIWELVTHFGLSTWVAVTQGQWLLSCYFCLKRIQW